MTLNIRPKHIGPQPVGSTGIHTDLVSGYITDEKAFFYLIVLDTDGIHYAEKTSGYQYTYDPSIKELVIVVDELYTQSEEFTELDEPAIVRDDLDAREHRLEPVIVRDDLSTVIETSLTELVIVTDSLETEINVLFTELVNVLDQLQPTTIIPLLTELINVTDSLLTSYRLLETSIVKDTLKTVITTHLEELIGFTDEIETDFFVFIPDGDIEIQSCVLIDLVALVNVESGSLININEFVENNSAVSIVTKVQDLVPVTSYSDPANVFAPTIIVDGVSIITNPSSAPGGSIDNTSLVISMLHDGLIPGLCEGVYSFSMQLDYNGGSFSLSTETEVAALGETLTFFGLTGAITRAGRRISNAMNAYTYSGTFGSLSLHKAIQLLIGDNPAINVGFPGQNLFIKDTVFKGTVQGAAQAIAEAAGVELIWAAHDAELIDFLPQSGMTALEALNSFAGRVGATLKWNGSNKYLVDYLDKHIGEWIIPSVKLVSSGGMGFENIYDVETGLIGQGTIIVPTYPQQDAGTGTNPGDEPGSSPIVNQVGKLGKKLTDEDPPLIFDLPLNYDKVYIQILVAENQPISGNNLISLHNYMTKNPQDWFEYDASGFGIDYVFNTFIGGVPKPQVRVDHRVLPQENDAIDSDKFILSMAATERNFSDVLSNVNDVNEQKIKDVLGKSYDNLRFITTYEGDIEAIFFGSIPMPGMFVTITCGDITVSGIIESVNVSFPGLIKINVVQYKRVEFLEGPISVS